MKSKWMIITAATGLVALAAFAHHQWTEERINKQVVLDDGAIQALRTNFNVDFMRGNHKTNCDNQTNIYNGYHQISKNKMWMLVAEEIAMNGVVHGCYKMADYMHMKAKTLAEYDLRANQEPKTVTSVIIDYSFKLRFGNTLNETIRAGISADSSADILKDIEEWRQIKQRAKNPQSNTN